MSIDFGKINWLVINVDHILQSTIVGFTQYTEARILNLNIPESEFQGEYTLEGVNYSFTMKVDSKGSLISYAQKVKLKEK